MKNLLLILSVFILLVSCSEKEEIKPDEPKTDYSVMVPKIIQKVSSWQSAINNEQYDNALVLTRNSDEVKFTDYSQSSIYLQLEEKPKLTIKVSEMKESSNSNAESGEIILNGKIKIIIQEPNVPNVELSSSFVTKILCSGNKLKSEDWKIMEFKIVK